MFTYSTFPPSSKLQAPLLQRTSYCEQVDTVFETKEKSRSNVASADSLAIPSRISADVTVGGEDGNPIEIRASEHEECFLLL